MKLIAADTHAALWFLEDNKKLTRAASEAFDRAERILLPSICLVEITYLVEKQRLASAVLSRIYAELDHPSTTLQLALLDQGVALAMQDVSRFDVPDMPDRIIAATALYYGIPLVTCDGSIRASGVVTIW